MSAEQNKSLRLWELAVNNRKYRNNPSPICGYCNHDVIFDKGSGYRAQCINCGEVFAFHEFADPIFDWLTDNAGVVVRND